MELVGISVSQRKVVIIADLADDVQAQACPAGMGALHEAVKDGIGIERKGRPGITDPQPAFPQAHRQFSALLVVPDSVQQQVVQQG